MVATESACAEAEQQEVHEMTKAQIEERKRGLRRLARKGLPIRDRATYMREWRARNKGPVAQYGKRSRSSAPRAEDAAIEPHEQRVARLRTEKPACPICKRKAICWDASDRVLCLKCGAQEGA